MAAPPNFHLIEDLLRASTGLQILMDFRIIKTKLGGSYTREDLVVGDVLPFLEQRLIDRALRIERTHASRPCEVDKAMRRHSIRPPTPRPEVGANRCAQPPQRVRPAIAAPAPASVGRVGLAARSHAGVDDEG
eukprot:CAMPEP_0175756522 /NCGR_PEP_ID=MMETSP0097-20121207/63979_1 /TAXON_ID=311494 /ORGANISM="Alexandrium monilatum, Strain CCMP3105" /LENGTH=132 /DNA_ID=CAMNT_0017065651 /DNA_START=122 /DNA_END=520 /DNA_ORIENTATION=-